MRTRTRIRTRAKSLSHGCPWLQFVLETDTLTEVMKEAFQEGKLTAKYVGNAGGSGGLRDGWPSVSDFASMFEAAVRTESVRNLVRAHKEAPSVDELELDAELMKEDGLMKEELAADLSKVAGTKKVMRDKERELAELEASVLAMAPSELEVSVPAMAPRRRFFLDLSPLRSLLPPNLAPR